MKALRIAFIARKLNYCISSIAYVGKKMQREFETEVISSHALTTNTLKS